MEFKEYFELEEFGDKLCSENIITSPLKFAGGVGGNLIGQNIRGGGNILKGAYRGAKGLANTGLGTLQTISGNSKKGNERIKKGLLGIAGGIGDATKGIVQSVASPVTSVLRGAQAVDDDQISGILSPKSGNKIQNFLGLSGQKQVDSAELVKQEIPKSTKRPQPKSKNTSDDKSDFYKLIDSIRSADGEKRRLLIQQLKNKYPDLYNKMRVNQRRSRPSADPSGRLRGIRK